MSYTYDIVLSFAGENRNYVEKVAVCLKENNIKVFYDNFEEADLWGKNLLLHFRELYKDLSKYCIIFTSKYYAEKLWTNQELQSVLERVLLEKGGEYILPAKFDDTEIPGIRSTLGYIDLRKKTPEQVCKLVIAKLNIQNSVKNTKLAMKNFDISLPKIKKRFSDVDKEKYLSEAFNYLNKYFINALIQLEENNEFINTNFKEITDGKFIATIYYYGDLKVTCKIWKGSTRSDSICYLENNNGIDVNNDSTLNESLTIEDDGYELYFRALMNCYSNRLGLNPYKLLKEGVAKFLWGKFTDSLER